MSGDGEWERAHRELREAGGALGTESAGLGSSPSCRTPAYPVPLLGLSLFFCKTGWILCTS